MAQAESARMILCAHADQNGDGAHWKREGEPCGTEPDPALHPPLNPPELVGAPVPDQRAGVSDDD